jgi:hypothetical protein
MKILSGTKIRATASTVRKSVKFSDQGKGTLTGTVEPLAAPFSVVNGSGPFSLPPKGKSTVTVTFDPALTGPNPQTLLIDSSDPKNPSVSVLVTGVKK